jgi:hypothetical protein
MPYVPCYVSINDYIEKLRNKPVHQRERMVIAATAVSFLIILVIWLVSFAEMNKDGQADNNPSAIDQLNDFQGNMGESKKSIEEMWNQLPSQNGMSAPDQNSVSADNSSGMDNASGVDVGQNTSTNESQQPSTPLQPQLQDNSQQNNTIPQLP